MVRAPGGAAVSSGLDRSRLIRLVTTAMAGTGTGPSRRPGHSSSGRTAAYRSARAVPAPTRITSHSVRSRANRLRSASLDSPALRPRIVAAPSALLTMFARTQGRPESG